MRLLSQCCLLLSAGGLVIQCTWPSPRTIYFVSGWSQVASTLTLRDLAAGMAICFLTERFLSRPRLRLQSPGCPPAFLFGHFQELKNLGCFCQLAVIVLRITGGLMRLDKLISNPIAFSHKTMSFEGISCIVFERKPICSKSGKDNETTSISVLFLRRTIAPTVGAYLPYAECVVRKIILEPGFKPGRSMAYSPTMMRFGEADPAGYIDGPDVYQLEGGNPINRVVPSGHTDDAGYGTRNNEDRSRYRQFRRGQ